tara:strand:- start:7679 stop:8026 length:348 start_codon:yes stop_codon:yes gene_type:complete
MSSETRISAEFATDSRKAGLAARVGTALAGLLRAYRGRRSLRTLIEADDRMLRDIGVTRDDVRWALQAPAGQDPSSLLRIRAVSRRAADRSALHAAAAKRTAGETDRASDYAACA